MKFEEIVSLLSKYGPLFLAAALVVAPIVWSIAALHYQERIETLSARVDLLKEEKRSLEDKLRLPPPPAGTPEPVATPGNSPGTQASSSLDELARLPHIVNPKRPTKEEIRDLARFYGLFNSWSANPHLRYKEGDISYWYGQRLTEEGLKREFESRRTVLQRAERTGEVIPSQGDLSHKAEQLQSLMRRP